MAGYCVAGDLLLGGIPVPTGVDPSKVVSDAADEIDSKIGFRYATPVDVSLADSVMPRPVKLLLKRLNVFLATGRLILAVTSNAEDQQLHAYGLNLINEANAALSAIAAGEMVLEGAEAAAGFVTATTAPLINNLDPESSVEAFYNRVANPDYLYSIGEYFPGAARYGNEQGMVR